MIVGHVLGGPADAIIELGLPVLIFAALWWWSARKDRKRKSEADGGPKATPLDKERRT